MEIVDDETKIKRYPVLMRVLQISLPDMCEIDKKDSTLSEEQYDDIVKVKRWLHQV